MQLTESLDPKTGISVAEFVRCCNEAANTDASPARFGGWAVGREMGLSSWEVLIHNHTYG